jgi:SAM-dependent methyltransferase
MTQGDDDDCGDDSADNSADNGSADTSEPDHVAVTRGVYDFSAGEYARLVGTTVSPAFERPIDRAVLDVFAHDVRSTAAVREVDGVREADGVCEADGVREADGIREGDEVRAVDGIRTLDVGCGVGRVTAYLHGRGLDVRGVDLSPEMVAIARTAHPQLRFDVAPMTDLPFEPSTFSGVVLWYCAIHTPPDALHDVWREAARVTRPSGWLLVAFQAGDNDVVTRENAYGSGLTMTWFRHRIEDVERGVIDAGFRSSTRVWRAAELPHESTPQVFLTFRRN